MTDTDGRGPSDRKVAASVEKLREAVAAVERGQHQAPLVDESLEERLAPLKNKATRLISHRDRSTEELRRRLTATDGIDGEPAEPELVDIVIERCTANGMLDDHRFATEWVRQRQKNQRKSVTVLRRELRDKGVAAPLIDEALSLIDPEDQDAVLRELVTKKAATVSSVPGDRKEYDKYLRRIVGVAARRGFPEGKSLAMARDALDARLAELRD